jgi:hypothetical protein
LRHTSFKNYKDLCPTNLNLQLSNTMARVTADYKCEDMCCDFCMITKAYVEADAEDQPPLFGTDRVEAVTCEGFQEDELRRESLLKSLVETHGDDGLVNTGDYTNTKHEDHVKREECEHFDIITGPM